MKYSLFKDNFLFYLKINFIIFFYTIFMFIKILITSQFFYSTIKKLICNCNHFHIAL